MSFTPPQAQIDADISAMHDSVGVINAILSGSYEGDATLGMQANVKHLEYMLTLEYIIEHDSDKTVFNDAITAGNAYLS